MISLYIVAHPRGQSHDSAVCSGCSNEHKITAAVPFEASDTEIDNVAVKLKQIPKLCDGIQNRVTVKFGLREYGAGGIKSHHALTAEFAEFNVTLVLHIGVSHDGKVVAKIQQRAQVENVRNLGEIRTSAAMVVAHALACAESFGSYSYVTNNCHHYCQHLGDSFGFAVYSFKSRGKEFNKDHVKEIHDKLAKQCKQYM